MKHLIAFLFITWFSIQTLFAYTEQNIESANFLAQNGIINDNSDNILAYWLDNNITRREMLKVMMKLSWKEVTESCQWDFSDLSGTDWWCKYAEAALREWFIAANDNFRPGDNVTQIEALKMIMQAKNTPRDTNTDDWRAGYVSKAQRENYIDEGYFNYDEFALRGFIFDSSARSYDEFLYTQSDWWTIAPEIEELLESIFDL